MGLRVEEFEVSPMFGTNDALIATALCTDGRHEHVAVKGETASVGTLIHPGIRLPLA